MPAADVNGGDLISPCIHTSGLRPYFIVSQYINHDMLSSSVHMPFFLLSCGELWHIAGQPICARFLNHKVMSCV